MGILLQESYFRGICLGGYPTGVMSRDFLSWGVCSRSGGGIDKKRPSHLTLCAHADTTKKHASLPIQIG